MLAFTLQPLFGGELGKESMKKTHLWSAPVRETKGGRSIKKHASFHIYYIGKVRFCQVFLLYKTVKMGVLRS